MYNGTYSLHLKVNLYFPYVCKQAYITNLGLARTTVVNEHALAAQEVRFLAHRDVILIGERRLRWEYPEDSPLTITHTPLPPAPSYMILTPTTKSPISWHNVEGWWCWYSLKFFVELLYFLLCQSKVRKICALGMSCIMV